MKKRSREYNIFSMSALDLFASALGAFILITVVLFPFFPNTGDSPERISEVRQELDELIESLRSQLQDAQTQLSAAEAASAEAQAQAAALQARNETLESAQPDSPQVDLAALQQCQASEARSTELLAETEQNLESCRASMAQTFVLVVISWPSTDDVDLHVVDPAGNEYYYDARNFAGSDAALEEDNTQGPGNEIWLSPAAMPGEYQVFLNMYEKRESDAVSVRGSVLYQDGRQALPETVLRQSDEKPLVARFTVDAAGAVTVR